MKIFSRSLQKTRRQMSQAGGDDFTALTEALIMADVGAALAAELTQEARAMDDNTPPAVRLTQVIAARLRILEASLPVGGRRPLVILTMGVNGSGKTTSIAKLCRRFAASGKTVLLAAGDTFRAAAREQLSEWAEKLGGIKIIAGDGDPAAVAFDAVAAAQAQSYDVALIDTAGRLPSQPHLMAELAKIRRATGKASRGGPDELLLVLDATTGQNALAQIAAFDHAVGVTGLILSKLDGSAKGGFALALAAKTPKPVRFVGVGEGADDLEIFDADAFARALTGIE